MKIIAYGNTDAGKKRRLNEDSWVIDDELKLFIVADGMGGHKAGEVASNITINRFPALLKHHNLENEDDIPLILESTINQIHKEISIEGRADAKKKGMGTTLCLLFIKDNYFYSTNIGDSPIFLCREGEIFKISKDHSFVQEQLEHGMISSSDVKGHPFKNVLTQSVGGNKNLKIPIMSGKIKADDQFLLCSDGLSNPLDKDDIFTIISGRYTVKDKVDKLINRAKTIDGSDNITSILVHIVETDSEESLLSDDTLKFDNIFSKDYDPSEDFENNDVNTVEDDLAPHHAFEADQSYSEADLPSPYEDEEFKARSSGKGLKIILSILIIILFAMLIYLARHLYLIQTDPQRIVHTQKESLIDPEIQRHERDDLSNYITEEDPAIEFPTIRQEDEDTYQYEKIIGDIPSIEDQEEDTYIDIDIIETDIPEEAIRVDTDPDIEDYDHYKALKDSFYNRVYKEKDTELLNLLSIRFARYIREYPDLYSIRQGAFSDPERSVFGKDFYNIIKDKDFFILMKDDDNIRWYILFTGLYSDYETADAQKGDRRVNRIGDIFDREPIITN